MTKKISRSALRSRLKARKQEREALSDAPDAADNPSTRLMIADVVIRAGSYVVRRTVEKGLLQGRYGPSKAQEIVSNRTLGQTVLSLGLAKVASRSLPGALVVGGGAIAKTLYDRRKSKRQARESARRASAKPVNSDE